MTFNNVFNFVSITIIFEDIPIASFNSHLLRTVQLLNDCFSVSNPCFYTQLLWCCLSWDCANILGWPGGSMVGRLHHRGQQRETARPEEEEEIVFLPASSRITQTILLHSIAVFPYHSNSWIQHKINSSSSNRTHSITLAILLAAQPAETVT